MRLVSNDRFTSAALGFGRVAVVHLAALYGAALGACVDDSDDGKPSTWMAVAIDAGAGADASGDGAFALGTASLALSCRSVVVSEHTLAGFSVQALDGNGNPPPPPGMWVALSPSTGTVLASEAGGGRTDARGLLEFAYAAPHFDLPVMITLEAALRASDGMVAASDRCSFTLATAGLEFTTPSAGAPVPFAQRQAMSVHVVAEDVAPSCAAGGGVSVAFAGANRGGFAASPTDPLVETLCLDIAAGGDAQFWVQGSETGGTARVEARADTYRSELALQLVGAPATLSLKADTSDLTTGSAANLTVRVADNVGQGVAGVSVLLELTRCAASVCESDEKLTPSELVTAADGTATAAYFAGNSAGAAQLKASIVDRPNVSSMLVLRVR